MKRIKQYIKKINNEIKYLIKLQSSDHFLMSGLSQDLVKDGHPCNHARMLTFKLKNLILFFMILIIIPSYIHSQPADLPFEHFSVDEGMPTVVNYIFQDRTGYLWFATNSGLYKYDGYNFTSYKHDIDDYTSLIDNTINIIYEDKEGVIWIGTWLGLEMLDRITNTFKHYKPSLLNNGKNESEPVWSICEDKYGKIWVGTGDGLFTLDKKTQELIYFKIDSTASSAPNTIGSIYEDKENGLWIGANDGLYKFDFKRGKLKNYLNDPNERDQDWYFSKSIYKINKFLEDDEGIFWLATMGGLVELNPKTGKFNRYMFNPEKQTNVIAKISQDVLSSNIWLATWAGLFSFNKKSKKFTRYNTEANCVISERSGTLWIGTNTEIKKVNRLNQPFKNYMVNQVVCAVRRFGRQDEVWVWTFSGYKKFDLNRERFIPHQFGKGNKPYFIYSENEMLLQTEKGGFFVTDTLGNTRQVSPDSLKDFNNSLTWSCRTKNGYWTGDANGGFYFTDAKTTRFTKIRNLKQEINLIFEDKLGLLWISTLRGKVFCYDPERDSLAEFMSIYKNPSSISGRHVTQIFEDTKGRLWFTTTNGLNRYDRSTNQFTRFTKKNGLAGNNTWDILEDDHGHLWILTTKGISKFDPETNHFTNYDASYGVDPVTDVYFARGHKAKNGEMYFPGAHGFTRFHPDSIKDNPFIPPVIITSFKKSDKSSPFSKEIHLPFNDNFISFEFAALNYISPERNQYAYMMEGVDKDWVYSGTRRYASYPNLDPGEYTFRVKGSNNDGVWNEAGTSVLIIISPPWWKTNYAYIVYSLLVISLIYFMWKMQMKRIKMSHDYEMNRFEAEKLHEMDEMKSRFFANISHEFRTPLTLILGPVRQIIGIIKDEKIKNDLKIVHKNANRLLGLVNQLLDISKLESGSMKLQTSPQNIIPLLKVLLQSFCSYAERKRIILKFNSEFDEIIVYIDKDKIEKIITNILSNALKFTPEGGEVELSVKCLSLLETKKNDSVISKESSTEKSFQNARFLPSVEMTPAFPGQHHLIGDSVKISIRDSGIGIPKEKLPKIFNRFYQVDGSVTREQEGTGIGLSLTKELVELHKGKIEVESEEGKGTTFTISILLGKEHLKPEEICESLSLSVSKGEGYSEEIIYQEETTSEKKDISLITETKKTSLLIVEDNSDVRDYIKNNLEKDYRILEAIDGEDGLSKSIDEMPDLIVSDVMMPKMDGFKLCDKLKTDERTSHIPIILLTAKASSQDKIEGLETGADDYVMKPFDTKELKARIKNLIEQRKRIHEHFRKHGLFEIEEKDVTPVDKKFLEKIVTVINEHLSDTSFGVELLAEKMSVSRSLLLKKIEALVGESPNELIKRTRLNKAAKLIENKFGNISEIALEVGFNNPSYFSECFKKQFGCSPSQYFR